MTRPKGTGTLGPVTSDPTTADLLARVAERYATARSYRDTGENTTNFSSPEPLAWHTSIRPFSTAFVRPDRFRFEFRSQACGPDSEWHLGVIWLHRNCVHRWWGLKPAAPERVSDLGLALAGFTGVSGGTAHAIPQMLGLCGGSPTLPAADATRILGRECLGDRECFVLEGVRLMGDSTRLWIDATEHCLVQQRSERIHDAAQHAGLREAIERALASMEPGTEGYESLRSATDRQRDLFGREFRTEAVTVWHPEFDVAIDDAVFEFEPPG